MLFRSRPPPAPGQSRPHRTRASRTDNTAQSAGFRAVRRHEFDEAATARALAAVGLESLQSLLDVTDRWDQRLNDDEKQSLAIARILLQRPKWVVLNGALEVLDTESRRRFEALFRGELAATGVIDIGKERQHEAFFVRRVQLVTDPQGPTFSPSDRLATSMQ